ncbi:MAG: ATP-binding protein [Bacteroidales bacterium]|nr:ATP-binding protein [Bacteroidales bacterium]
MLVSFSFGNFKSFKEENTISFVAEQNETDGMYSAESPFEYSVLKAAAVYGANASGKSKLFEAFDCMRKLVCPPRNKKTIPVFDFWKTQFAPFRLSTASAGAPTFFEVVILIDDIQYRYGVELDGNGILDEWLYRKKERESLLLSRKKQDGNSAETKVGKAYINSRIYANVISAGMLTPDVPLLTLLATFNDELCKQIVVWFGRTAVISANDMMMPIEALMDEGSKQEIINFMRSFDFNIEDLAMHEMSIDDVPDKIRSMISDEETKGPVFDGVQTTHRMYNELYERVGVNQFMMERDESFGTNRLLRLSWPILKALKEGRTLFVDEIDSGIHPFIVTAIIRLFYKAGNGAQLIINTQNTSLLSCPIGYEENGKDKKYLFRKDQVYIVNKNRYGESNVYPITHFQRNIRTSIEKMYLDGRLTGVPYVELDNIYDLIGHGSQEKEELLPEERGEE